VGTAQSIFLMPIERCKLLIGSWLKEITLERLE
jgi:hypothetical protein